MPGDLQPLAHNFKVVDDNGFPTFYFIKWAEQRQIDITASVTAAQAQTLIDDWAAQRDIIAGNGLTGGGSLAADRTLDVNTGTGLTIAADQVRLADTAVTPGTYGDATHVAQITVDQQGRITAAAPVTISGGGGGGTTPAVVQVKSAFGATSAVTLSAGPTAGNMLIAIATHWNTLSVTAYTNAGWTPIDITNGASTDGYLIAIKYAVPGESATQTPFAAFGSGSTSVFEISGALVAIPLCRSALKEITTSPMVVPLASPKAGSLLIGVSCEAGSSTAFTVASGVTLTVLENITGTTANNSPRRTQTFSSASIAAGTAATVTTTFTPGNMVGVSIILVGS